MTDKRSTLSIVTATYNAAQVLPNLVASLRAQTDQDFEWVVADGGSTDETLAILKKAADELMCVKVDSRPDFGIYDALNRGVGMANGQYYVVLGADDQLCPDAVANYRMACGKSGADLVTAKFRVNDKIISIREPRWEWLYGQFAHVSGHAVGLAIRRCLHDHIGFYSRKFPIAADQLFILQAVHSGAVVHEENFVAGVFDQKGISCQDAAGSLTEAYRVQLRIGHGFLLQTIILILRILKNYRRII